MKKYDVNVISFKRNILMSVLLLIFSIACLYSWAILAPLESASIAPGFVRAEGQNQKVEHLFGGKVEKIHIIDGQIVNQGDELITLDNRETKTTLHAKLNEYLIALAQRDMANAMLHTNNEIYFNRETVELAKKLDKSSLLFIQTENFMTTRQVRQENEALLLSKNKQIKTAINAEVIKLSSLKKQYDLSSTQLDSYNKLVNQKHVARLQIIDLEKEMSQIKSKIGSGKSLIEEKQYALKENDIKVAQLLSEERQHAAIVLAEIEESIPALQASITRLQQSLAESIIRAPVSGKITDLKVSSVGETVKSGEELMKVLPDNDKLIIEARLNTSDIESISEGQQARVRLTAYNFRNTPMLDAHVAKISADRMQDELGYFYQLQLEINKTKLDQYPNITLSAGMPAEGIIINDKRTVMDYLLEPIKRGINRSLRES